MPNRITLGSKVTLYFNGQLQEYTIVQSTITNPCVRHVSYHSPFGRALLGKACGDRFIIKNSDVEIKDIRQLDQEEVTF